MPVDATAMLFKDAWKVYSNVKYISELSPWHLVEDMFVGQCHPVRLAKSELNLALALCLHIVFHTIIALYTLFISVYQCPPKPCRLSVMTRDVWPLMLVLRRRVFTGAGGGGGGARRRAARRRGEETTARRRAW